MGEVSIAAIDIGTNTVLLTVAEIPPHPDPLPLGEREIKVLHDDARITRLGQGLNRDPNFLPEAQERALAVLKEYKTIADSFGATKILAVGTAAFRKARNRSSFVDRVFRETGIRINVISGEEEARLSYLSAAHDFGDSDDLYVLDIGGGSTEVISKNGAVSMDLGAVVLTETFVRQDPPSDEEIRAMAEKINTALNQARRAVEGEAPAAREAVPVGLPLEGATRAPMMIALAGSVTTLSAIKQGLVVWDGAKVQGSILTMADVDGFIALFRKTTNEERRAIPGMVKGREDTILAGTLILRAVMEKIGVDRVTVSDRGLRFGLIYEV